MGRNADCLLGPLEVQMWWDLFLYVVRDRLVEGKHRCVGTIAIAVRKDEAETFGNFGVLAVQLDTRWEAK